MTRKSKQLYTIDPYIGVGSIRFGMSIEEVRQVLAAPVQTFWKSETSEIPTDAFDTLGIHVYYKLPGICVAIEFWGSQANPTFQEQSFLKRPYRELEAWFREIDSDIEVDNSGLTSFKFGIGLYAPGDLYNPYQLVESVIVFEYGYYN